MSRQTYQLLDKKGIMLGNADSWRELRLTCHFTVQMAVTLGVPETAHALLICFCNMDGVLSMWKEFGGDGDMGFIPM